ncbi:hypothetical protein [Effusibacillus pohliae]|uniref:hypothetical protein n=1 Tax=Effusibacillus pohliae TaxID=232270 RepID=UPI0003629B23|nr:hypothetical protein [Effusibacillus pohliae]
MKAVVATRFGGPEVLEYREVDRPAVSPKQVLIRVAAASVNFADIKAVQYLDTAWEPPEKNGRKR